MRFGTLLLPLLPALLEQLANSLPAAAPCNCPPRPAVKGPALISPPNPHVWVNPEQAVYLRPLARPAAAQMDACAVPQASKGSAQRATADHLNTAERMRTFR